MKRIQKAGILRSAETVFTKAHYKFQSNMFGLDR